MNTHAKWWTKNSSKADCRIRLKGRPSVSLFVEELESRILLDGRSAGPLGINARDLTVGNQQVVLTGDDISIGEVEHLRVGSAANGDGVRFPGYLHPDVKPVGVYHLDQPGDKNRRSEMGDHPLWVAGIMNSTNNDDTKKGVAPKANLYSSGFDDSFGHTHNEKLALVSMLRIASLQPTPVAINMSFGFPATEKTLHFP